jgi:hypothetical protein
MFIENSIGIYCEAGYNFIITQNIFKDNDGPAIEVYEPNDVEISQNIFIDNQGEWNEHIHWTSQLYYSWGLTLHDDERKKGNFWNDHTAPDDDHNGIVDEPYVIRSDPDLYFISTLEDLYTLATPGMIDGFYDLTATSGNGSIELKWKQPFYPDPGKIVGYQIQSGTEPSEMSVIETVPSDVGSFVHTGLENGIGRYYVVQAVYDGINGYPSNMVQSYPDGEDPWVNILYPEEGQIVTEDSIRVEWEGGDNSSGIDHFSHRDIRGKEIDLGNGTYADIDLSDYREGNNTLVVKCYDRVGRCSSDSVRFIKDMEPPIVWLISPAQHDHIRSPMIEISWMGWDKGSGIDHYTLMIAGTTYDVGMNTSIRIDDLVNGYHEGRIEAFDKAGRSSFVEFDFIKDYHVPEASILSPSNGSIINDPTPTLYWKVVDPTFVIKTELSIDDGPWNDIGNIDHYYLNEMEEGEHHVRIRITGASGYIHEDSSRFTIDATRPEVTFFSPIGNYESVNATIIVDFSERMNRSHTGINVLDIPGRATWVENRLFFHPDDDLPYARTINVAVHGMDLAGNLLSAFEFSFNTTDVGWIEGICFDENGKTVSDAVINLNNGLAVRSDEFGYYRLETEDGSFEMIVTKAGYEPYISRVVVESGRTTAVDPILIDVDEGNENKGTRWFVITMIIVLVLFLLALIPVLIYTVRRYPSLTDLKEE